MRATLLVIVAFAATVVAGCGGSDDQTASVNGQTITVPADVHGVYGEIEAVLDQYPYQHWYSQCVVARVKKALSPSEAKGLTKLPDSEREKKVTQIVAAAGPACEKATGRPVIDPNASEQQLDLLRAGNVEPMREFAEEAGLDPAQVACVQRGFENLPDKQIIGIGNGSQKIRKGIILSVFEPCAKVK